MKGGSTMNLRHVENTRFLWIGSHWRKHVNYRSTRIDLIIIDLVTIGLYASSEYVYKRAKGKWCCQRVAIRQLVSCGILGDIGDDGDQLLLTQWLIFTSAGRRREGEREMAEQQLAPRQRTDTSSSSRERGQHNTSPNNFKSAISVCTKLSSSSITGLWSYCNAIIYFLSKWEKKKSSQNYSFFWLFQ